MVGMLVISEFRRLRQENLEFQASPAPQRDFEKGALPQISVKYQVGHRCLLAFHLTARSVFFFLL